MMVTYRLPLKKTWSLQKTYNPILPSIGMGQNTNADLLQNLEDARDALDDAIEALSTRTFDDVELEDLVIAYGGSCYRGDEAFIEFDLKRSFGVVGIDGEESGQQVRDEYAHHEGGEDRTDYRVLAELREKGVELP